MKRRLLGGINPNPVHDLPNYCVCLTSINFRALNLYKNKDLQLIFKHWEKGEMIK